MKHFKWQILLGISLVALSAFFYFIHYMIFHDLHHIFIYLVGDIAFVFIEVLLVTLIIDEILNKREKQLLLKKLNMVIGAFFSEIGTGLLRHLSAFDPDSERMSGQLILKESWSLAEFSEVSKRLKQYQYRIDIAGSGLNDLKDLLLRHREFMLRLLENSNLLEHDSFTNLLMAVFHLTEELAGRSAVHNLPTSDLQHIAMDMTRAYRLLIGEWLDYMNHLRVNYPYLFTFAIRTNPFDPNASITMK